MDEILKILGCKTETEAVSIIARFDNQLRNLEMLTGATSGDAIESSVRESVAMASALKEATGKQTVAEAVGALNGMKAELSRVSDLEKEVAAERKKAADVEAKDKIDASIREGRLPPSNRADAEKMYSAHGVTGLESFLNVLRPSGPGVGPIPTQPTTSETNMTDLTKSELTVSKAFRMGPKRALQMKQTWQQNKTRSRDGFEAYVFDDDVMRELNDKHGWAGFQARPDPRPTR